MLSDQQVAQFRRDGFLDGGPCLTADEVDELRAELGRVIADRDNPDKPQPSALNDLSNSAEDTHIWWMLNIWMASEPYKRLLEHPKITEEVAQLTDAQELRVWHDAIWYKPAERGGMTTWHQDAPQWPVLSPMTEVSAWVALDDVDEDNGCMSMVPGSHLWGDCNPFLHSLPDVDAMPSSYEGREVRVVRRPMRKGEVHYHHALTWHGAHPNTSGRPRRGIAIHYMLEGTRFVASGEHIIKHLITVPDGAPVEGPDFPLCYSRAVTSSGG